METIRRMLVPAVAVILVAASVIRYLYQHEKRRVAGHRKALKITPQQGHRVTESTIGVPTSDELIASFLFLAKRITSGYTVLTKYETISFY